jgi:hypothetical protein
MARLLQRNKKVSFSLKSKNPVSVESITVSAAYCNNLSPNIKKILKNLRKRSFYRAVEMVNDISNISEQNFILQIIYSAATYAENNHCANLLKLWIDEISIQKISKSNAFINQDYKNLEDNYLIIFNLSFQYKDRQVKKDLLW